MKLRTPQVRLGRLLAPGGSSADEQLRALRQQVYDLAHEVGLLRADGAARQQSVELAHDLAQPRRDVQALGVTTTTPTWVPPGHFYSPLVDTAELASDAPRVFDRTLRDLPGLDLRHEQQLRFLDRIAQHYPSLPFSSGADDPSRRYRYDNPAYSFGDAIVLGSVLMELRPSRLLEFGSGWSSCAALDVADACLAGALECTFVDPYPDLLRSLLLPGDQERVSILESRAQDVDLDLVRQLQAGDVLFLDTTHVSKAGSDVNFHLFTVLPLLASGVWVHIHDVFWPFEYPEAWFFEENRSWNELYLLRAWLQHNDAYEIVYWNDYVARAAPEGLAAAAPLAVKNPGGALWLRKR